MDRRLLFALVPLIAHLAFSWIGFNPTDDGFVLAYGRRLLDGQVPHRDFIAIRPVGASLLHLPELLVAGDFVIAASRLVWWCELAVVAWVWVPLLATSLGAALTARERFALRLLVLMLSAHVAPPRAWHTVDGLALASVGIAMAARGTTAGYALVSAAALCKQSFAPLAPLALVALGDSRRPRCWIALGAPVAFYVAVVTALGGGTDLVTQLGAQSDVLAGGLVPYGSVPTLVGIAVGALVGWMPRWTDRAAVVRTIGPLTVLIAPLGLFATAATGSYALYARVSAFGLFGFAFGRASALVGTRNVPAIRAAALVLAVAWASAISIGYRTPAYASGLLAALILLLDWPPTGSPGARGSRRMPIAALMTVTLIAFVAARTRVVYRDRPAAELDRPLGAVFRGGDGIRTNARTYAFLADLNHAIDFARARGRRYAILPDVPGHWATSAQPNPLPVDWPQAIELRTPALVARVTAALDAERGRVLILVQKVRADTLATAAVPLTDDHLYPIVTITRAARTKIGETEFFEIYE